MQSKKLFCRASAVFAAAAVALTAPAAALANTIESYSVGQDSVLVVGGKLDTAEKGIPVNVWLSKDGKTVYVGQTKTTDSGRYSFSINMSSFKNGGEYSLKTIAQIEDADSENFEYYSKTELDSQVYTDIFNHREDAAYISDKLSGEHKSRMIFTNQLLKPLIDGGYSADTAALLSSELKAMGTYLQEEFLNAVNYTANVKTIEHLSDNQAAVEYFCAPSAAETSAKHSALGLSESKALALFEKNADTDSRNGSTDSVLNAKQLELKKQRYSLFVQYLKYMGISYSSRSGFVSAVEEALVMTDIQRCRGTESVKAMIENYAEKTGKIDLGTFNSSSNNREAVIKSVTEKIESGEIKRLSELQSVLDKKILTESSGGGSSSGRGNGSGGGSGIVVTPPSSYNDSDIKKPDSAGFADMENYSWAADSVNQLLELGMISGISATQFAPGDNVTRAQFSKMMCKAFSIPEAKAGSSFADVSDSAWYAGYVSALADAGYINGKDGGRFEPDSYITREEACAVIYRIFEGMGLANGDVSDAQFGDFDNISDYAKQAVSVMAAMQIILGDNGMFMPKGNMTRAQAAVIMYRIYGEVKQ